MVRSALAFAEGPTRRGYLPCDRELNVQIIRTRCVDVPVVVLVEGKPRIDLSDAMSRYAHDHYGSFVSSVRAGMMALLRVPGFFQADGTLVLTAGIEKGRDFMERLVRTMDGVLTQHRGGRPGYSIWLPTEFRSIGEKLFLCMGILMRMLIKGKIYTGANWLKLLGYDDLTEAQRTLIAADSRNRNPHIKRWLYRDKGFFYRFTAKVWVPVRTEDVRWAKDIMQALKDAPLAIFLYVLIQATSGCRPGEPQWITFWDLLAGEKFDGVMLRNKHQGTTAEKKGLLGRPVRELCERYVETVRRQLDPDGREMDYYRGLAKLTTGRSAKTPAGLAAKAELQSTYVLLNTLGRRLRYKSVWRECRKRFGDIPATLHWLRHEFVFNRLRAIEKISCLKTQHLARMRLVAYMGWRSEEQMLACYDAYNEQRMILETTLEHIATVDFGIGRMLRNDGIDEPFVPTPTARTPGLAILDSFLLEAA